MFDTMTLTKIVGGFCGALLVFMMGNWAADDRFIRWVAAMASDHQQPYVIDTGEDEEDSSGRGYRPDLRGIVRQRGCRQGRACFQQVQGLPRA